jgi:hypothetical protein
MYILSNTVLGDFFFHIFLPFIVLRVSVTVLH